MAPTFSSYPSLQAYNTAHPDAQMPMAAGERNELRSFICGGAGLDDDLTDSDKNFSLDFLPGGAPKPGEPDRVGTVVASRWGAAPYHVLAENVSLRRAWEVIGAKWPDRLSDAFEALRAL